MSGSVTSEWPENRTGCVIPPLKGNKADTSRSSLAFSAAATDSTSFLCQYPAESPVLRRIKAAATVRTTVRYTRRFSSKLRRFALHNPGETFILDQHFEIRVFGDLLKLIESVFQSLEHELKDLRELKEFMQTLTGLVQDNKEWKAWWEKKVLETKNQLKQLAEQPQFEDKSKGEVGAGA